MNLDNIFSSYVAYEKLNLNLEELTSYCYEKKKEDPVGIKVSNYGGWQSKSLNLNDEKIKHLFNSIVKVSIDVIDHYQLNDTFAIEKLWININEKCDYNRVHIHPESVISGCFYVKVPKQSGNIVFQNPNSRIGFFEKYFKKHNYLTYSHYDYVPEENMIYMFPSWLEHYVEPNRSNEDRISIAFNIGTQND